MPNLSMIQILVGFFVIILGVSFYQVYTLKDRIYCSFVRRDKTQIHKLAKITQDRIDFDGAWYNIDIRCTTQKFQFVGILPTWTRCLNYRYNSAHPINPDTGTNNYDDPKEKKALDRSASIQSLANKQNTIMGAKAGKKGMLESLMPIILVLGILILGYLSYSSIKKNR